MKRTPHPDLQFSDESGFALLESVVALIACSLILTLFFQVVGRSVAASQLTSDRLTATSFALSTLDGIGHVVPIAIGTTRGVYGNDFHWVLEIGEASDAGPGRAAHGSLRLVRIMLSIEWMRDSRRNRLAFKTLGLAGKS